MPRRHGRSELRQDLAWAGACAADSQYRSASEEIAADALEGFDPNCRYAADGFELGLHACTRRDGQLVRPGDECWMEQRAQVLEQGKVLQSAEAIPVFDALRQGLS